jgi:hypothetical protein
MYGGQNTVLEYPTVWTRARLVNVAICRWELQSFAHSE